MADVLVVAAIAFFVAAMLGLIWALGRISATSGGRPAGTEPRRRVP
jgi:hypothetical protein